MLQNKDNERERDRQLYSFTHANQEQRMVFGFDTTTPEGQAAFRAEWDIMAELAPEMVKKEDLVFPHELPAQISNEPHFRRVWQHYRSHMFRARYALAVEAGTISSDDDQNFRNFIDLTG